MPKQFIVDFSEGLLAHYVGQPLIDAYDVYQHLMDYWADVMQDDVYQIAAEGWKAKTYRILVKDKKGKEKDKGWACDLVPKPLIVARYFADEQAAIDRLQADFEAVTAERTELEEEHSSEDEAFSELEKINKGNVTARIIEIEGDADADEIKIMKQWLEYNAAEAKLKKQVKTAEARLDEAVYAKYPELSEGEIKTLVVDDKWLSRIDADTHSELDRISQSLTQRVSELAQRYGNPLSYLSERVEDFGKSVDCHLGRMGFEVAKPRRGEVRA